MYDLHDIYEKVLFQSLGPQATLKSASLVAAGNHNQGIRIESSAGDFFLKLNFDHEKDILKKESHGLEVLRKHTFLLSNTVKTWGRLRRHRE